MAEAARAAAVFPEFDTAGHTRIGAFQMRAQSPLELVVDNFNELEHAGVNHTTFGFDQKRLAQARVQIGATETTTHMLTKGPTKRGHLHSRWFISYNRDSWFCSDTCTHYSPVYSRIDHWWETPDGRGRPASAGGSTCSTSRSPPTRRRWSCSYTARCPGRAGRCCGRWRGIMLHEFRREIGADVKLLANMADYSPGMEGMKLSRFDKILGLTRERINRIYRGQAGEPPSRVALPVVETRLSRSDAQPADASTDSGR